MSTDRFLQLKSAPNTGASSASTLTFTPDEPLSANNAVVGWIGWDTAAGNLSSVTDSFGTTYTLGLKVNDAGQGRSHQHFYSAKLASSGVATITATLTGSSAHRVGQVCEYAGVGVFDGEAMNFAASPGPNSFGPGVVTTTTVNGLIWANTEAPAAPISGILTTFNMTARFLDITGPDCGVGDTQTFGYGQNPLFSQTVDARRITGQLAFKVVSPDLTVQPNDQVKNRPDAATFTLTAGGATSYQWQDNRSGTWADVIDGSGGTTATYTTPATTGLVAGRKYRCVTSDGSNIVNTRHAVLAFAWIKDGVGRRTRASTGVGPMGVGSSIGASLWTRLPITLAGDATVQASAAGSLGVGKPLAGAATVQAGAAGELGLGKPLAGAATVQAGAAGELGLGKPLAGAATVQAGAAGGLQVGVQVPLGGAAVAGASATGDLETHLQIHLGGQALVSAAAIGAFLVDTQHLSRIKVAARPRYWFARSARGPFVARAKDRDWSVHA